MSVADELDLERRYLAHLYDVIEQQRKDREAALADVLLNPSTGFAATFERDRLSEAIGHRLSHLDLDGAGICFGKLVEAGSNAERYIGRIALADEHLRPLLIDWRAPVAEPFYRATAADPMGMVLRRHLIMSGRRLVDIEDDLLSANAISDSDADSLVGEAALLLALNRERTGFMGDIVATIQRDQDEIIRHPLRSTLIVTGGPGTGKTVVALHRAAYLLYSYRKQIDNNGVLIVGPSNLFLRYIARVLPSLGESSVLLLDWASLLPEISAQPDTDPTVADLKGSLPMAELMARAVQLVERAPADGVMLTQPDGEPARISAEMLRRFRQQARSAGEPHNRARARFVKSLTRAAGLQGVTEGPFIDASRRSVQRAANRLWPLLTPEELLRMLFENERLLGAAARGVLEPDEYQLLLRNPDAAWEVSDLPLLDELRVLLGPTRRGQTQAVTTPVPSPQEIEDAQVMLADVQIPFGLPVDAAQVVARYAERPETPTLADQARRDPTWKFAHVVVDEAQDVSPMQWRALARRCQGRSMTIVGDPDQRSRPAAGPWVERITSALAVDEWEERSLHVNYRTPAEIVGPAQQLRLRGTGVEPVSETRYVRSGVTPWATHVDAVEASAVRAAIERARAQLGERGRLAVISSERDAALVANVVSSILGEEQVRGAARLSRPIASYVANEVKGLEFDAVVVVDPARIEEESGWRQLYVVLTRPTKHLGVVLVGDLASFETEWLESGSVSG